ncbi:hypothetical protein Q9L42_018700 [Methylomarinum sp. Ch1-1]|uniref:Uncharacterized protein n=1 Tax=Methylomarinum roseum TaxID=3067653 RepID=A0AAU7NTR2_9GAMM|nr:hypothetical protein [Methylomarinum sp. Ch1-1]MDP4519587.1 hypothetical protein [Methylomarinum sp. Ch1-1]
MYANSLTVLFNYIEIITYLEFALLTAGIGYFVYLTTPQPLTAWQEAQVSGPYLYLHATWFGRVPLWQVFWPFFLLFNAMLIYVDYRAVNGAYTIASWATMHIIFALPVVYWTVAVWRASTKCGQRWQAFAARFITASAYFEYAIRYLIWKEYPFALFDCRQMMIEFGDCFFN